MVANLLNRLLSRESLARHTAFLVLWVALASFKTDIVGMGLCWLGATILHGALCLRYGLVDPGWLQGRNGAAGLQKPLSIGSVYLVQYVDTKGRVTWPSRRVFLVELQIDGVPCLVFTGVVGKRAKTSWDAEEGSMTIEGKGPKGNEVYIPKGAIVSIRGVDC